MSTTITQRELRNMSGEIMRRLDEGETFVVTRAGQPVGQLSPLRRPRFVGAEMVTALFGSAPAIDARRFRRDLDEAISQDIEPRG
ncbi:MAG: type II toxin-antitoxin system Phd/YefM family antitoxin [Acidimicrobiia bacterium]